MKLSLLAALSMRQTVTVVDASAKAIPDGMRAYLTRKLTAAISTPGTAQLAHAGRLVDALVAAAPKAECTSWVHQQFDDALKAVEKEPQVADALTAGEIGLLDAVARNAAHSAAAAAMYHTINGHHRELRAIANGCTDGETVAAAEATDVDEAWRRATADGEKLRAYAEAATQIGSRGWVRAGIAWMAEQATGFFCERDSARDPQLFRLARKAATKLSYDSRGTPLDIEEEAMLRTALRRERASPVDSGGPGNGPSGSSDALAVHDSLSNAWSRPVRLLDVGACGTLFDAHAGIDDTPIDLCPQEGNARVMQCDFLELALSAPGSEAEIVPSADFPGGCLRSLPAGSFDAVALSLVLSYLPTPQQRGAMIRKARSLLPTPDLPRLPTTEWGADGSVTRGSEGQGEAPRLSRGLLLIVDTFSVDGRQSNRNGGYVQQWINEIEAEGFVFLRHTVLQRSHALAFASAPSGFEQAAAERTVPREPPALRMRREERGPWDPIPDSV